MTWFLVGFGIGAVVCALLVWLDPGPGPRALASASAWQAHERRRARLLGWPLTLLMVAAVGFTFVLEALGGRFETAFFGFVVGTLCVLAVVAIRRYAAARRAP